MKPLLSMLTALVLSLPAVGQQVLEFGYEGCMYCELMKPVVAKLKGEGRNIVYFDRNKYPDIVRKFNVTRFPTFIAVQNGKEVSRVVGQCNEGDLIGLCTMAAAGGWQSGYTPPWEKQWEDGLQVQPQPPWERWNEPRAVQIRNSIGSGFSMCSGSVVSVNGDKSYVLTCAHAHSGPGDKVLVLFSDGTADVADVVATEQPLTNGDPTSIDVTLLKLRSGSRDFAFEISDQPAQPGQRYTVYGFPGTSKRYTPRATVYRGVDSHGHDEFSGQGIEGESGAAVCNSSQQVVAVLHSNGKPYGVGTFCCPLKYIRRVLDAVLPGRPGAIIPRADQPRPQQQPQPKIEQPLESVPPPVVQPAPDVDDSAWRDAVDDELKRLQEAKQDKGDYLQAGDLSAFAKIDYVDEQYHKTFSGINERMENIVQAEVKGQAGFMEERLAQIGAGVDTKINTAKQSMVDSARTSIEAVRTEFREKLAGAAVGAATSVLGIPAPIAGAMGVFGGPVAAIGVGLAYWRLRKRLDGLKQPTSGAGGAPQETF